MSELDKLSNLGVLFPPTKERPRTRARAMSDPQNFPDDDKPSVSDVDGAENTNHIDSLGQSFDRVSLEPASSLLPVLPTHSRRDSSPLSARPRPPAAMLNTSARSLVSVQGAKRSLRFGALSVIPAQERSPDTRSPCSSWSSASSDEPTEHSDEPTDKPTEVDIRKHHLAFPTAMPHVASLPQLPAKLTPRSSPMRAVPSRRRHSPLTPRAVLPVVVFTSTQRRARETAHALSPIAISIESRPSLNILDSGIAYMLKADEIFERYPKLVKEFAKNSYRFRFPGGESHQDKALDLEALVLELERQVLPSVVISHSSTLQVLYGYFLGPEFSNRGYGTLNLPRTVVIELTPSQYGWKERRYDLSTNEIKELPACSHGLNFYDVPG